MAGWAAKRRLRRVDLPAPEGPDITIGRFFGATVEEGSISWLVVEGGGEGGQGSKG